MNKIIILLFSIIFCSQIFAQGIINTIGGNTVDDKFIVENSDAEAGLVVTGEGKVGVGITNPVSRLSVGGDGSSFYTIYGESANASGVGVFGKAAGSAFSGIVGSATNTGDVTNYGGYFDASGKWGIGVYGYAEGSDGRGVSGYANGTNAYAGYFDGRSYFSGNVGIGTTPTSANLQVSGDNGVLFTGTYGSGNFVPPSGAGTRMMWYPEKAAFRAGSVWESQWDDANIGAYSTATGLNTIAKAFSSTAMGSGTIASGHYSTAMGRGIEVSGDYSFGIALDIMGGTNVTQSGTMAIMGGEVGIGITNPSYLLQVGTSGAFCNGGAWVDGSSRKYKDNILQLGLHEAMETLIQLDPVKFNYKTDITEIYVGFIAEDVPDLVATNDRKGISPMDIVAVLTKVVQEQQKTNKNLIKRIEVLENK